MISIHRSTRARDQVERSLKYTSIEGYVSRWRENVCASVCFSISQPLYDSSVLETIWIQLKYCDT